MGAEGSGELLCIGLTEGSLKNPTHRLPDAGWMAPGGSGKPRLLGVTATDAAAAAAANAAWLEDCVVRLLCVLALDRFGDFVSDQARSDARRMAVHVRNILTLQWLVSACKCSQTASVTLEQTLYILKAMRLLSLPRFRRVIVHQQHQHGHICGHAAPRRAAGR